MTVFVGPSIWRNIDVRTATATFAALAMKPTDERVIFAPLWNDALIGRSRSIMCTEFLKTDADVMVIIDDDVVFEAPDFWKIVEGARATRGIYGGAYVTRSVQPHLTSRPFPGTTLQFASTPNRRPVEIQYLATGFFAFHRDVLERMIGAEFVDADGTHRIEECQLGADRPFYPVFKPFDTREEDGRRHYLSEDWAFCNRARQLGIRVWLDQSIILAHMGLYPFTVADLDIPGNGLPSTGIDVAEFTGPGEVLGDPLRDTLIRDIAEYCEEDEGDVRRMLPSAVLHLNELWRTKPADQSEADWYRREDVGMHYLADLAHWHLRGAGGVPREIVETLAGKRVLDFGAGNGMFLMDAARAGASVVAGVEINPVLSEFAEWRFEQHPLPRVPFCVFPSLDDYVGDQFDAICAWHVFEHLPDPEAVLDELLAMLAPGGVLITQSGFDDATTAQHHLRSDWEDVLRSRGLEQSAPWVYRPRVAVPA